MSEYPGYLKEGFEPYDPIELMQSTEGKVCRGEVRKYSDFYCVGVYGGISTGYLVGCCLCCVFCWVNLSRDFPDGSTELAEVRYGQFYTPGQVAERLIANARRRRVDKLRLPGGEPTLVSEWVTGCERLEPKVRTAWLSLDEGGNDPTRFLFGLRPGKTKGEGECWSRCG